MIYWLIGRLWVEFIKRRHARELRIAAATGVGLALTALGVGAYLASRDTPDES